MKSASAVGTLPSTGGITTTTDWKAIHKYQNVKRTNDRKAADTTVRAAVLGGTDLTGGEDGTGGEKTVATMVA